MALLATGNSDAEAAMGWLFQHIEDADIDNPIVTKASGGWGREADRSTPKVQSNDSSGIQALTEKTPPQLFCTREASWIDRCAGEVAPQGIHFA
ncbi:hypothetical protein D9611_013843 [Ephemerocybe angulata]|uniref:UBA domain-containing protein n=1 Tax=Ephemerocybe angulata TaxID=980116 RepID=A0A8H5F9S2_9AGAR|nr:hypothetical protein D9611_013843 [Tulosesus angulatus]